MRKKMSVMVILLVVLSVFGVWGGSRPETTEAEPKVVGEWSFKVDVIGGESFEFTHKDAQAIGPQIIMAAQKDGDDTLDEQAWTGILLVDFLEYIGVEEFSVIAIEGGNGNSRELDPRRIDKTGTGFGWMVDGEVLDDQRGPIQLINHDRGPNWWIEKVSLVTIIQ